MSSEIKIINPIEHPNWDNLLLEHDDASFFHTVAWAKTLSESYNYTPLYFTLFRNNKISALVPLMKVKSPLTGKRGVSLPFTDYCRPIVTDHEQLKLILDQIISHGKEKNWKHVEFRGYENVFNNEEPSAYFWGHILSLSENESDVLSKFRNSNKRNIQKAIKEGVKVDFSNSLEALKEFYRLNCITRKKHGLPPQPYTFFKKLHDNVLSKDKGLVVLASHKHKNIAGAVYFHFGEKAMYKYGASDDNYQQLRANNLIMWEAIKYYSQNGYKSLCFGRTDLDHQGLRQFKLGWGTEENMSNYYIYDLKKGSFVKNAQRITPFYNKIFGTMPIPLLKLSGNLLYRHMG